MRLEVTRKSDLAVRCLRALAARERSKGPELAGAVGTTPGFVAQVMHPLVRQGWAHSDPGPQGGYSLSVDLRDVSVADVIEAVEGPTATGRCVVVDRPCDEQGTCVLHAAWSRARGQLLRELRKVSIAEANTGEVAVR